MKEEKKEHDNCAEKFVKHEIRVFPKGKNTKDNENKKAYKGGMTNNGFFRISIHTLGSAGKIYKAMLERTKKEEDKMMFKTHMAFGFLIGLLAMQYFYPGNQVLFMLFILLGSLLPDIDHPKSKVGRKVKVIAMLFEHRGFFHGFISIIPILFFLSFVIEKINLIAVAIGYASHLIADALTVEGIMPFHPISKWRLRGFLKTGAAYELFLLGALVVIDACIVCNC